MLVKRSHGEYQTRKIRWKTQRRGGQRTAGPFPMYRDQPDDKDAARQAHKRVEQHTDGESENTIRQLASHVYTENARIDSGVQRNRGVPLAHKGERSAISTSKYYRVSRSGSIDTRGKSDLSGRAGPHKECASTPALRCRKQGCACQTAGLNLSVEHFARGRTRFIPGQSPESQFDMAGISTEGDHCLYSVVEKKFDNTHRAGRAPRAPAPIQQRVRNHSHRHV
jgi:hypothetical protein